MKLNFLTKNFYFLFVCTLMFTSCEKEASDDIVNSEEFAETAISEIATVVEEEEDLAARGTSHVGFWEIPKCRFKNRNQVDPNVKLWTTNTNLVYYHYHHSLRTNCNKYSGRVTGWCRTSDNFWKGYDAMRCIL